MLADDGSCDVKNWLEVLVNKSLIEIDPEGYYSTWAAVIKPVVVMHKLLEQVGKQAIRRQEPWKRQILINAHEICDILQYEKGTRNVSGISFDTSGISEVTISDGAFKRMPNLRFLSVYKRIRYDENDTDRTMHISEEMEFPPRLRLLQWSAYPSKCLPRTFNPEYLVELYMGCSPQLEKLWEGRKALKNLKYMDLSRSKKLKELPDLSNATNLERLNLEYCESLVEIPSTFSHLHKLQELNMRNCINLQDIPQHMNLASLEEVDMTGCSRLRKFPVISTHIKDLSMSDNPELDQVNKIPSWYWCRLENLRISSSSGNLKGLTSLPNSVRRLSLTGSDMERIPDCVKALHQLEHLYIDDCRRLTSLPELPSSLEYLKVENCESLETLLSPLYTPEMRLYFINCFKLGEEARRAITRRSEYMTNAKFIGDGSAILPGRQVPAEFGHRAKGNSLTILLHVGNSKQLYLYRCMVCVVISPQTKETPQIYYSSKLLCRINGKCQEFTILEASACRREHLFIFHSGLLYIDPSEAGTKTVVLEFNSKIHRYEITECGVKILIPQSIKKDRI